VEVFDWKGSGFFLEIRKSPDRDIQYKREILRHGRYFVRTMAAKLATVSWMGRKLSAHDTALGLIFVMEKP